MQTELHQEILAWIRSRQTSAQKFSCTKPWETDTQAAQIGRYSLLHISQCVWLRASVWELSNCNNLLIRDQIWREKMQPLSFWLSLKLAFITLEWFLHRTSEQNSNSHLWACNTAVCTNFIPQCKIYSRILKVDTAHSKKMTQFADSSTSFFSLPNSAFPSRENYFSERRACATG